jgi:hypothetical protein
MAGPPKITQLSAELEMKDFHDSTTFSGPLEPGVPVTLKFKNNATVKVIPVSIQENVIRLQTEFHRTSNGSPLYNATFITRYNADAELYEKRPDGDLLYRLKLNPHTEAQK